MDALTVSALAFCFFTLLVLGIQQIKHTDDQMVASRVRKLKAKEVKEKLAQLNQNPGDRSPQPEFWRRVLTSASRLSPAMRLGRLVDKKLAEADVPLRGEEYVVLVLLSALVAGGFFATVSLNLGLGLAAAVVGGLAPHLLVNRIRTKRLLTFNSQIGDALVIMANSLRSGFSFLQAMDMVCKELPDPIRKEFSRTFREINLGTPTEEALQNLALRVKSDDLDLVVTAVLIQRQVGGNLAEVLDNIAETIRERIRIKGEVKTLTAQGRISGIVIGLLPLALVTFMLIINPAYIMTLFTNSIGLALVSAALLGQILGILLIKKIVNIEV
ncbi:MAG: type II secretion system F family protein [Bacillota bacterium]